VAFNPDGLLAVGGSVILLWDVATRRVVRGLGDTRAPVYLVAVSPDGKRLAAARNLKRASGPSIGEIQAWDVRPGQSLLTQEVPPVTSGFIPISTEYSRWYFPLRFSPDGRQLAFLQWNNYDSQGMSLRDAHTGEDLWKLQGMSQMVTDVVFPADGKLLALAYSDGTVRLWNLATKREIGTLRGDNGALFGLHFDRQGRLTTCDTAGRLTVWDPEVGQYPLNLHGHLDRIRGLAVSPNGRWLASATVERSVKLWDPSTGQVVHTLRGHTDA